MKKLLLSITIIILLSFSNVCASDWEETAHVGSFNISKFQVVNDTCIYAFGDRSACWYTVLRSRNQGENWDTLLYEHGEFCYDMWPLSHNDFYAFSEEHVLATTNYRVIRETKDGFESIQKIHPGGAGSMKCIAMFDEEYGLVASSLPNRLYITKDSCKTWDTIPNLPIYSPSNLFISEKKTIFMNGFMRDSENEPRVLWSHDEGKSWDFYECPKEAHDFCFLDSNEWWALGSKKTSSQMYADYILHTTNGGKEWKVSYDSTPPSYARGLADIDFYNSEFGVAVGTYGKILRTEDGGKTWVQDFPVENLCDQWVNSNWGMTACCECISENEALIGTYSGHIYKYSKKTGVKEVYSPQHIQVYPNPIKKGEDLLIDFDSANYQIQIFSVDGKLIKETYLSNDKIKIDSDFSTGTYFLMIKSGGNIIASEKIIVE